VTVLEIGHPTWSRPDADRVAQALLDQDACASVRLVAPEGPCDGWAVVATYLDNPPVGLPQSIGATG
jgi:hypothetical protein